MTTTTEPKWKEFLENNKWTTYLAYQLKPNPPTPDETLLKYEALLTQCSYLSRMAYCPADIFCRMTQHLDVTPNAFNNYIRAIEKIYDKLFNYKCSFDSKYIQEHPEFAKYFNSFGDMPASQNKANNVGIAAPKNNTRKVEAPTLQIADPNIKQLPMAGGGEFNNTKIKEGNKPIGFFVQNKEHMNVYLYVHHNPISKFNSEKTLFISFKGSSSIEDFKHDLKSAAFPDQLLSELNNSQNTPNSNAQNNKKKNKPGKAGYGFIKSLKPSIQDICKKIKELESLQFERVIITGHSLGGALASLFGYYLKKYNPDLIDKPIHVITFGACCVFDAFGRNEFNAFLNIEGEKKNIFTLDRVTANLDPIIVLPADLDHPGFTIPRDENFSYTRTGRTKEIGEIRDMLELKVKKTILTADDLLSTQKFVELFFNFDALKVSDTYDEELYKKKI